MSTVCLDTHAVIWGIQGRSSPNRTEMISKAQALIQQLSQKRTKVIIPSIVIAELLVGIPIEDHENFYRSMERRFIIPPFDLRTAARFARIWKDRKDLPEIKHIVQTGETTKNILKADCMIVATAIVFGATCIYSHDPYIHKFANGHIEVQEIPDSIVQSQFL